MTDGAVNRRWAIGQAVASNRIDGLIPSAFGRQLFEQWIAGHWSADEAVQALIEHHKQNPAPDSDNAAQDNMLQLTDSRQLKQAEADITTVRMAAMLVG